MTTTEGRLRETAPASPDEGAPPPEEAPGAAPGDRPRISELARPVIASALTALAAGLMTGGIFGTWGARVFSAAAVGWGAAWAVGAVLTRRSVLVQTMFLPATAVASAVALAPDGTPSRLGALVRDAVSAGRVLRPPVPFDPGWRPLLFFLLALVGFAVVWVAVAMAKPRIALLIPLPVLGLTAVSQPAEGELAAALIAFLPLLLALAVLFGGERGAFTELSSAFELKRTLRGLLLLVPVLAVLFALNSTSLLFPKPIYNPSEKPQKPKPIPLGAVRDRVLFEVDGPITGPWRTGVLDVYDGRAWRLPPFDAGRFEDVPADGVVDDTRTAEVSVAFTVRDLGAASALPGLAAPVRIERPSDVPLVFDMRTDLFRVPRGRVPKGIAYEISAPAYPKPDDLRRSVPPAEIEAHFLDGPAPPGSVRKLLENASPNAWSRFEKLRGALNDVVVASGAGVPTDVPPSKVEDLLTGSHEGTPFEIVAAEALLARWSGVPSRIGFGFDGGQKEKDVVTVRPRNASNWLEVSFEGFGWVPLVSTPPRAKATLESDPNSRFDPTIQPSEDIAVELILPVEVEDIRLLYERIREGIVRALPFVAAAVSMYVGAPAVRRAWRRRKRRAWALHQGPRERIAVEYAEFRDLASDLGTGHPVDTALEFCDRVAPDDEHEELAWLVTRVLYGDLTESATEEDVEAAERMSASLRRRMFRAQPPTARVLAVLSRASLREPFSLELPTVRLLGRRRARAMAGSPR